MRVLLANVRFTLRLMRRNPGFYALVLLLLTAGIGTTTAMLSVVESVIVRPLPYEQPEDLVDILRLQQGDLTTTSAANFLDWREQGTTFEQMAAVLGFRASLSTPGTLPVSVDGAAVTGDYFTMLRLKPLIGRLLGPDDDHPGAPYACVISEQLWQTRFGSDPGVVGRTISLNSRPCTVVGVAPQWFTFGSSAQVERVELWNPLFATYPVDHFAEMIEGDRGLNDSQVMGRRRHGVSLAEAQAQMNVVAKNLESAYPDSNAKTGIVLRDLHQSLLGDRGRAIWLVLGAVVLVFVVITANVANLLLARAQARRGELATRLALGVAPSTLAVQLVTETVVLFAVGSILGAVCASMLVHIAASELFAGSSLQAAVVVRLDVAALLAGITASLLFGLAAGVGPAILMARVDPAEVLKQSSVRAGNHKSQTLARSFLVVTQLAVAFALLTGSGLAVHSFFRLLQTAPGFDARDLATAQVVLPGRTYDNDDKKAAFFQRALDAIGALPGVQSVSGTSHLPMSGISEGLWFDIEGRPPWPQGDRPALGIDFVGPSYFETMRIPVLEGRGITAEDTGTSRHVMVLSKKAAERYFPGESALGHRLRFGPGDPWREVVGVVADVRKLGLDDHPLCDTYTPFSQGVMDRIFFVAKTRTPDSVMSAIPGVVQALDPELAVSGLETMEQRVSSTADAARRMTVLLAVFALAALLLATLGLFGLVSYTTAERTREIGIRIALGTPPESVVGLVVRGGMKLVLLGLGIGLALSVWVAREVAAVMPGGTAFDPAVVAPIPLVLALAGLLACFVPAWRAVRTPPASALRYE